LRSRAQSVKEAGNRVKKQNDKVKYELEGQVIGDSSEMIGDDPVPGRAAESGQEAAGGTGMQPTEEWTTAALAHASVLLVLVLGMAGGVGALLGPIVPLVMYLGYRDRSRFIAFHALQSFIYQLVCILLYIVLAVVLIILIVMAWVVSGLLSAVLIGLLLMPFALVLTLMAVLLLICTPCVWIGYGLYAAYRVYQGQDFRYWLIGEWMEREVRL